MDRVAPSAPEPNLTDRRGSLDRHVEPGSNRGIHWVTAGRKRRPGPAELSLRGRIGAHLLHARYDSKLLTANARAAFLGSFERAVDPDGVLPVDERRRRAGHLRAAHFARLARLSAIARGRRARRGHCGHD